MRRHCQRSQVSRVTRFIIPSSVLLRWAVVIWILFIIRKLNSARSFFFEPQIAVNSQTMNLWTANIWVSFLGHQSISFQSFQPFSMLLTVWIRICFRNTDSDPLSCWIRVQFGSGSIIFTCSGLAGSCRPSPVIFPKVTTFNCFLIMWWNQYCVAGAGTFWLEPVWMSGSGSCVDEKEQILNTILFVCFTFKFQVSTLITIE